MPLKCGTLKLSAGWHGVIFSLSRKLLLLANAKVPSRGGGGDAHSILTFAHNLIIVAACGVYVCGEVLRRSFAERVFGFN